MRMEAPTLERPASGPTEAGGTKNDLLRDLPLLLIGSATFCGIALYFRIVGFDVVRSDALHYLKWSHHFWVVETGTHFPTYPFVLWLFRLATLRLLDGVNLLQAVTLISWIGGAVVAGQILERVNPASRRTGVALFGLFPFVGVTYAAYPVGDALFALMVLGALLALLKRAWLPFTLCVGIGLMSHKALWMPLGLLSLYAWRRLNYPLRNLLLSGAPLLCWYAWGYTDRSGLWMFERHMKYHFTQKSLPVLDGLLTPILDGGTKALLKSGFLISVTAVAAWLSYFWGRRREWLWLALTVPVLTMALVANDLVVWALARFAKPIAVPLAVALFVVTTSARLLGKKPVQLALWATLTMTQFASALYIDRMFFAEDSSPTSRTATTTLIQSVSLPTSSRDTSKAH
jgi:hypothetical protein